MGDLIAFAVRSLCLATGFGRQKLGEGGCSTGEDGEEETMKHTCVLTRLSGSVILTILLSFGSASAFWQTDGNPVSRATRNQKSPKIISDGAGGAIIGWEDYRGGNYSDIYVQRVNSNGDTLWTRDGVAVCTATDNQERPRLVSDGAGGAIITWQDYRSGSAYDIYARRVDLNGHVLWTANGIAVCTATDYQDFPEIVSDGAGGAIITWEDFRSGSTYDVYSQRLDSNGNVKWTTNGVAVCTAAGYQYYPRIVSDGAGGAIITWEDWRNGSDSDIYAQRLDSNGNVKWTLDGVAVCVATDHQSGQEIISDGAGGAIITWQDYHGGSDDIYAQRIGPNGNAIWVANGVAVCTADYAQIEPQIAPSGSGGAIITWEDGRNEDDIYAQRVGSNGNALWIANGIPVCTAGFGQNYTQIVSDGARGAIIVWQDYRSNSETDIYAQRVDSTGAASWTSNGVSICTTSGYQYYPQIISDGVGGAIITWEDYRGGSGSDIYVQRVDQNGSVIAVEGPVHGPSCVSLEQNVPNPFNPFTRIRFTVVIPGRVLLRIYSVTGVTVRTLADGWREPAVYTEVWDGRGADGSALPSGVYFYSIQAEGFLATRKMVLLR